MKIGVVLLVVAGILIALGVTYQSKPKENMPGGEGEKVVAGEESGDNEKDVSGLKYPGLFLRLSRGFQMSSGQSTFSSGGYRYEFYMKIGNSNPSNLHFDSVSVYFANGAGQRFDSPMYQDSQRIFFTEKGIVSIFGYGDTKLSPEKDGGKMPQFGKDERHPNDVNLPSHRAMEFHCDFSSALIPTICGKSATVVNVQLFLGGRPSTQVYRAVLPPLMKIPDSYKTDDEKWLELPLTPEANLTHSSKALDPEVIEKAFSKAETVSKDSQLVKIVPSTLTVSTYSGGKVRPFPGGWSYYFWSPKEIFRLSVVDPSAIMSSESSGPKPSQFLNKDLVKSCIIDCDAVSMLMEDLGAQVASKEKCAINLGAVEINGKVRPIWETGRQMSGRQIYVFADTAQIVCLDGKEYKPLSGVIWNE